MPTGDLTSFEMEVVSALAFRAALAARILEAWSRFDATAPPQTARSITSIAGLGVTEERGAEEIFARAVEANLIQKREWGFVVNPGARHLLPRLAHALYTVHYYASSVHADESTASVVLTKPPRPNALEAALDGLGWQTADLEQTNRAFMTMAQNARKRFVVMTPFFDHGGSEWLQALLQQTARGVSRYLVLRSLEDRSRGDYPTGIERVRGWLRAEAVCVYNYSLPRVIGAGRETFHAKVILSDDTDAYVGSANLTTASLGYSMEMGLAVTGKAARRISLVVDAVLTVADRIM
jgi:phosphatidylserine/phosphatidylglycerophosphate/cardiolipin synthase-like enzyme